MPRAFLFLDSLTHLWRPTMKITLPRMPTRNPLLRPCGQRHAGPHGPSGSAARQRNSRELRRELQRMSSKERPSSP